MRIMSYSLNQLASGSGFKVQESTSEALPSHTVAYLNNVGTWRKANAGSINTMPATGLTCEAIPSGGKGTILLIGLINNNEWSWTPGGLLYASTSDGEMTHIKPDSQGNQVQIVGRAITGTLILFNPDYYAETVS